MQNKKYLILSHTADIKIRFYGKNFKDLIDSVFTFYFDNLSINFKNENIEEKIIEIQDESFEFLIVRLINEMIYLKEISKIIKGYKLLEINNNSLKINLKIVDAEANFIEEFKSATYYDLKICKINDVLFLEITIDV